VNDGCWGFASSVKVLSDEAPSEGQNKNNAEATSQGAS
jgi:hypothetical protein